MDSIGARFVVTGEVLGQRPMSQHLQALKIIERESNQDKHLGQDLEVLQSEGSWYIGNENFSYPKRARYTNLGGGHQRRDIFMGNKGSMKNKGKFDSEPEKYLKK